jgi:hypothetical protein
MNERTIVCPSCASEHTTVFHSQDGVPAHSVMNFPDPGSAVEYPRGRIELAFCGECGFVFNAAYDPRLQEYSDRCEESQGFSPTFTAFARRMAEELIDRYDLHGKRIIEIGCGKGEFLMLLCSLGGNTGTGFDPAYVEGRYPAGATEGITFIKDFYGERYAGYEAEFVCCRMTLEHISETGAFIRTVRRSIGGRRDTVVHFQVPDVTRILERCAFEDVYYEHCSYFSPGSFARLFRGNGFEILDLRREYDDQYLVLDARPAAEGVTPEREHHPLEDDLQRLTGAVGRFPRLFRGKRAFWNETLTAAMNAGEKTVLWGSGSKAVSFLTTAAPPGAIGYVVDINPYRQGTYMAGTGQPIVAPEFLTGYRPDTVIVMNEIYTEEIAGRLESMGLTPRLLTLELPDRAAERSR